MSRRFCFLMLFLAVSCPLYGLATQQHAPRETWYERVLRQINPNDTDWGAIWEEHKREFLNRSSPRPRAQLLDFEWVPSAERRRYWLQTYIQ